MNTDTAPRPTSYRYILTRTVTAGEFAAAGRRQLCWVLLNPSTADEQTDDATIRRLIFFTRKFGFDDLVVVNLFAVRETKPEHLLDHADPIGPDNSLATQTAIASSGAVVVGWGSWRSKGKRFRALSPGSEQLVLDFCAHKDVPVYCLRRSGPNPWHPLYLPNDSELQAFPS